MHRKNELLALRELTISYRVITVTNNADLERYDAKLGGSSWLELVRHEFNDQSLQRLSAMRKSTLESQPLIFCELSAFVLNKREFELMPNHDVI